MEINSNLLHKALKHYYGYDEFRSGQEEIITKILKGYQVLAVLPTGAGKSVCFQLPSLLLKGITLVISPLVSLMKDQAENLARHGIPAAYLDSSMTGNMSGKVLHDVMNGKCKFLYVAPERLNSAQFINFAKKANITVVAVDEAHCVSQWGRSFRNDYHRIPEFLNHLPIKPIVVAFTASATPEVRQDILKHLHIENAEIIVSGFDRPNLFFQVKKTDNKERDMLNYMAKHKEECGVVYCSTRRKVENVTRILFNHGYSALRYHAGLTPTERKNNQSDFVLGKTKIIVATNAFGMGIDKPDVRYVLHYNMPKDMESYYQEAGRAGRDGKYSECLLLYSSEDLKVNNYFIEQNDGNKQTQIIERKNLKYMSTYCTTSVCLRRYMLQYFGEEFSGYCNKCSNCIKSKNDSWKRFF